MCDPLTAIGLGASGVGTLIDSNAEAANARRMTKASNDAAEAELARQRAFQKESTDVFNSTAAKFAPGAQQQILNDTTQYRANQSADAVDAGKQYQAPVGDAPDVVKTEMARRSSDASTKAKATGAASANLGGLSDLFLRNNLNLHSGANQIGTIGDFSGHSAALLPLDQAAARNNAYKAPGPLGTILKLGGAAASLAGGLGAGPKGWDFAQWFKPNNIVGAPLAPNLSPGPFILTG